MNRKKTLSILLPSMAFALSATAAAKEGLVQNTDMQDSSKVYDIDEIVVTSQPKDVFRLRKQPLSSSSFSSTEITSLGMHDLRDVSAYAPSFVMPNYGARYTSSIYVRGLGARINNPAVGIYMDGIPVMSKSAYNFHTYDISRIDIMRGPQGTLYGQNTEGGLIRIYSKSPVSYSGTDLKLGIGSYLLRNVEFGHYAKIDETMAYSLAGFYNGQNGFLKNKATNAHADLTNEAGGRMRFIFTPSKVFSIDFTADYQHVRQNAFAYGLLDKGTNRTEAPETNFQNYYRRDMVITGIGIRYEGNGYDIHSTTSYQYLHDDILMDQDYTAIDYMHLRQKQAQNAVTEELTIKSRGQNFWNWVFGAAASSQWQRTEAPVYFGDGMTAKIASGIQHSIYSGIIKGMTDKGVPEEAAAAIVDKAGGVDVGISMQVPGFFHTPQLNAGVFHESNISIAPRLTATIGLRYDFSKVKADYDTEAGMNVAVRVMGIPANGKITSRLKHNADNSFRQLLPKIALCYKLGYDNTLYALASKGYRAGGFNIQMFSDILQSELNANSKNAMRGDYDVPHNSDDYRRVNATIAYKPETSWNYEAGAHLNLFGGSTHIDLAAFYMEVSNQQLSVMAGQYGFGRMMVNAGKSRSIGFEASANGRMMHNRLGWSASYGVTHAIFKEYTDSVKIGGTVVEKNYKDKRIPYVPMHTLSASADYRIDFCHTKLQTLTIGFSTTAQGHTFWDEDNTYGQNFYALLNAYAIADFGMVKVKLWGKNLTGTRYNTFAVENSATGTTQCFAQRGMPAQIGLDVSLHL